MYNEDKVICNVCGKELKKENDIVVEDFLHIEKRWGYFSEKDGQTHKLIICENCYDELAKTLKLPVDIMDTIEMI